MSLISIIMPCYNSERTLKNSIDSVLLQSCDNWELIAVDDGSTDSTLQMLKEYETLDTRIKVFSQVNAGPGAARNFAISVAKGDYIAFLDSDDWWENDFIENVNSKVILENPDVIFYDLVREKEDGTIINISRISKYCNLSKKDLIRYQMTGKMEWGMVKVIRRSIIADNALSFSADSVGEEAVFSYLVLNNSQKLSFINKPIYHYVLFDNGQHKKGENDPWANVVFKMKEQLTIREEINLFYATINSFALRALSISCYRIAINCSYLESKKYIKEKINEYIKYYNFNKIEKDTLDKATYLLAPFIRHKFILPIYLASRIRNRGR